MDLVFEVVYAGKTFHHLINKQAPFAFQILFFFAKNLNSDSQE